MTSPFSAYAPLLVGFALGLRHATDVDHVVAVSTMLSDVRDARRGALVGAFWGLGHLLTLFLAGSALVLLRVRMSARAEWALELIVALVLIGLGAQTIAKCFGGRYHFHVHHHGRQAHAHLHFHPRSEPGHEHDRHAGLSLRESLHAGAKPLLVGLAHGLAGTAGLALLVLTSIPSRPLGLLYLLVFGLGALTGMVVFSTLLGLPLSRAAARLKWLSAMRLAAGASSLVLGTFLAGRAFLPQFRPF